MKTLIFADLHEPPEAILAAIESTITRERPDRVVFLGDYFDQWNDTPDDAARIAEWLKHSLADPRRFHLIGNHDLSYQFPCKATFCPGFTWEKEKVIRLVLGQNLDRRFVFHLWIDGWLLTHAGLSLTWVPDEMDADMLAGWLVKEEKAARNNFAADRSHWFVAVGPKRGGTALAGGLLWCDHREFRPIPGIRQIYGHTPAERPRWIGKDNLCLDTAMNNGPLHFAVMTDGMIETHLLSAL